MPIYEYKCQHCGYQFEKLVRLGGDVKCPKCNSALVKKLISTFSIGGNSGQPSNNSSSCEGGTCDINCPSCGG